MRNKANRLSLVVPSYAFASETKHTFHARLEPSRLHKVDRVSICPCLVDILLMRRKLYKEDWNPLTLPL